ncbi:MAG: polymer-forming cytoskeletal protein [Myxococcota bacterium]
MRAFIVAPLLAGGLLLSMAAVAAPEVAVDDEPPIEWVGGGFEMGDAVEFGQPYDDVFGMGDEIAVVAPVKDNAFLMGREIHLTSPVGGDLFAMGETIAIDEAVGGDVYAMGADVIVGPEGSVGGDIYGLGREIVAGGPVAGSLNAGAGRVEIAAPVSGDVAVEVGELVVTSRIGGDLEYTAPAPAEGIDSFVVGQVAFTERIDDGDGDERGVIQVWDDDPKPSVFSSVVTWTGLRLWEYLSKLLVGIAFIVLGGMGAVRVAQTVRQSPAESFGVGFLTLVLLPTASTLLMITLIPMALGFLGWLAFWVLLYLGQLVTAQWLGVLVLRQVVPEREPTPVRALAVGLIPVTIAFGLPWVWFLAVLTASLVGMGAIVLAVWRRERVLTPAMA